MQQKLTNRSSLVYGLRHLLTQHERSIYINTKMMTTNDDKAIAPERSLSHMEISYTF